MTRVQKRQKLMAGMPILRETDVDVNMDAHKLDVMAAMPRTTKESGLRGSLTGTRNTAEPRVEPCLTHRRSMRVG